MFNWYFVILEYWENYMIIYEDSMKIMQQSDT